MTIQIKIIVPTLVMIATQIFPIYSVEAQSKIKEEIISRCRTDMGEYGSAMVKACADMDIEAAVALNKVPEKYNFIVSRCLKDMREYGYAMVKACVDMDIEAEEALADY